MMNTVRLAVLLIFLLAAEAVYYALAGSWASIFSPQLMLLSCSFIGVLFGAVPAVLWAGLAGLLQELCFMGPSSILGLTPLAYCWTAFLASQLFFNRVDPRHFVVGLIISAFSLVFGTLTGAALSSAFGAPADFLSGPFSWGRAVSWLIQILVLGPLLMKFFVKVSSVSRLKAVRSSGDW